MRLSDGELRWMQARLAQRYAAAGRDAQEKLERQLAVLAPDQALLTSWCYAASPLSDWANYDFSLFRSCAAHALHLWEQSPSVRALPEQLFLNYVLHPRVNEEELCDCRGVFYAQLAERIQGLSACEAILAINAWNAEQVCYRSTDGRTISALGAQRSGFGRCGEESTFAVNALRAAGIPARQVYTPRWAHTDDNHAWVEAWADGHWYFFGACEPEPVLNLGWFNSPASRGMLMHTKVFGRYNGPEEIMLETPNYTEINVTENYAPIAKALVTVKDRNGQPVTGARVEFKVYNYAEFYTVATKYTDASGQVSLTAGKGDMLVWASDKGTFGFSKLSFSKQPELTLTLDKKEGDIFEEDIDIVPPVENPILPEVTPEQRAENDRRMMQEDSIRNAYVATFPTAEQADSIIACLKGKSGSFVRKALASFLVESRGNHDVLVRFLNEADRQGKLMKGAALLSVLTKKDLRDVPYEVLIDHLLNTKDVPNYLYDCVIPSLRCMDASVGDIYDILAPRISTESLTPYKSFFQSKFSETEIDTFRNHPQALVEWVNRNITIDEENNFLRIPISPEGVWRAKVADSFSRDIFFVALARSLNIAADMRKMDGRISYMDPEKDEWGDNRYVEVDFDKQEEVEASRGIYRFYEDGKAIARDDKRVKYYNKFTISRLREGRPELISCDEEHPELRYIGTLDTGYYLLVTGTRLADGGVLARLSSFVLPAQKDEFRPVATKVPYHLRESGEKVAVIGNFNSESLFAPVEGIGEKVISLSKQSILQTCGRGYFVVAVLGVGQEPTNHALRDIAALGNDFEQWGRKMVFLFPSEEQYKKFNADEFKGLPSTITYGIDTDDSIRKEIVQAMNLNNSILPVFIIADTFNRVVFVSQGYTIGLGEQLMKVVHGL